MLTQRKDHQKRKIASGRASSVSCFIIERQKQTHPSKREDSCWIKTNLLGPHCLECPVLNTF